MRVQVLGTMAIALAAPIALSACNGLLDRDNETALVAAPSPCHATQFEVYFADSQAHLTDAARQTISLYATQLQGCEIGGVRVLGLADARGGATANQSLSERRAQAVAEALTAAGWPANASPSCHSRAGSSSRRRAAIGSTPPRPSEPSASATDRSPDRTRRP